MNAKAIAFLTLGLALIGAGCTRAPASAPVPAAVVEPTRLYCSSDGTLVTSMPTAQSHRSYCIKSDAGGKTYALGDPNSYTFTIIDDQGDTLRSFAETHTKLMHVFVVRKDLAYFEHVYPAFDPETGTFSIINLTFRADGAYRIIADFAPASGQRGSDGEPLPVTASEDITAGSGSLSYPLGGEGRTKTFGDLTVMLQTPTVITSGAETTLTYELTRDGKPVTDLEPYLGALGHAVFLREGTLDVIHTHAAEMPDGPQNGQVDFTAVFPEAGKYKAYAEFQRGEEVVLTDFLLTVEKGFEPPPEEGSGIMR